MRLRGGLGEVLAAVLLLALILLMVSPASHAPTLVQDFGDGLAALVQFAVSG